MIQISDKLIRKKGKMEKSMKKALKAVEKKEEKIAKKEKTMKNFNEIKNKNGIGLIGLGDNSLAGVKTQGVYETPGGSILHHPHDSMNGMHKIRENSKDFKDNLSKIRKTDKKEG